MLISPCSLETIRSVPNAYFPFRTTLTPRLLPHRSMSAEDSRGAPPFLLSSRSVMILCRRKQSNRSGKTNHVVVSVVILLRLATLPLFMTTYNLPCPCTHVVSPLSFRPIGTLRRLKQSYCSRALATQVIASQAPSASSRLNTLFLVNLW